MQAVDDVSFDVQRAKPSASSASPAAANRRPPGCSCTSSRPDSGSIVFDGLVVGAAEDGLSHRDLHRQMQMVFQDSYASLNPRLPVAMSIAFGPFVHGLAKVCRPEARA